MAELNSMRDVLFEAGAKETKALCNFFVWDCAEEKLQCA